MKNIIIFTIMFVLSVNTYAAESGNVITTLEKGNISKVVVDSAPGSVSAMNILGISADQTSIIENPRDITVAYKALQNNNEYGLSITPARTSLIPMEISTYSNSPLARLWASTTFSYAQGQADANNISFTRRAFAVETSYFFEPDRDDPLIMYWSALKKAEAQRRSAKNKNTAESENVYDPCILIQGSEKPTKNGSATPKEDKQANEKIRKQAEICRESVAKKARWNASRMWASVGSGQYQPTAGGDSHSLGKIGVLGITWGIGGKDASIATALTLAVKRTIDSPTLETLGAASPTLKSSTIATFRLAVGSNAIRFLLEASNVKDEAPTAADKTYKRAVGLDIKLSDEFWLNFRYGDQRRIDNSGDEKGSSFAISYSPKSLLNL